MIPLAITGEAGCTLEAALDRLVSALHTRGFNVYSKLDIPCYVPERQGPANCVLLRALYPRTDTPLSLSGSGARKVIHCSAILRELPDARVWIELSKPTRRLRRKDDEMARRAEEADRELRSVMSLLVEIEFPPKSA